MLTYTMFPHNQATNFSLKVIPTAFPTYRQPREANSNVPGRDSMPSELFSTQDISLLLSILSAGSLPPTGSGLPVMFFVAHAVS